MKNAQALMVHILVEKSYSPLLNKWGSLINRGEGWSENKLGSRKIFQENKRYPLSPLSPLLFGSLEYFILVSAWLFYVSISRKYNVSAIPSKALVHRMSIRVIIATNQITNQ